MTKTTRCCPEMQQTVTTLGVLKTPANKKKKKNNNNNNNSNNRNTNNNNNNTDNNSTNNNNGNNNNHNNSNKRPGSVRHRAQGGPNTRTRTKSQNRAG